MSGLRTLWHKVHHEYNHSDSLSSEPHLFHTNKLPTNLPTSNHVLGASGAWLSQYICARGVFIPCNFLISVLSADIGFQGRLPCE